MSSTKTVLLTAVAVSLNVASASAGSPYVAGDMHNHNTCTDGSVDIGYAIDRSVGTGVAAAGGNNFNLDWFTIGNHGGSGNRDCRFADPSANLPSPNPAPGAPAVTWNTTLGQKIQGITITALKGTPNGTGTSATMWRWQSIEELEYPILVNRQAQYKSKTLVEGLEWIVPGHEHTDVAVIAGQAPKTKTGNADKMAEFEFRFDRGDTDAIGPVDASSNPIWTGKDNVNNDGTAGHAKAVAGVTWLQNNYPLQSYAIPTHTERKGAFNPTGTNGYNIEHFRDFNNAGPTVAFGIESPGHFAQGTITGGSGSYGSGAVGGGTYGLIGVYHAKIGGLWDGLLGEGRNSFMFISSDWHQRGVFGARDAGSTADFFPGEFTKLYVKNATPHTAQAIVDGMRSGNSYSVNGDVIGPDLVFHAWAAGAGWKTMGETVVANPNQTLMIDIRFTVPAQNNSPYSFNNPLLLQDGVNQPLNKPSVDHIDLIAGKITGVIDPSSPNYAVPNAGGVAGASIVYNPNMLPVKQIPVSSMTKTVNGDGSTQYYVRTTMKMPNYPFYIRLRGTNIPVATPNVTDADGNPLLDVNNALVSCTDPACPAHLDTVSGVKMVTHDVQAYSNLWFYANPIFFRPAGTAALLVETNAQLAKTLASGGI